VTGAERRGALDGGRYAGRYAGRRGISKGLLIGLIVGGAVVAGLVVLTCAAGIFLPALGKARQAARQLKDSTQVRAAAQSIILYAQNQNGQLPTVEGWGDTLVAEGFIVPEILDLVRIEGGGNQMIYTPPPGPKGAALGTLSVLKNPQEWILVRENEALFPANMRQINVGFADGRVELRDVSELPALLARQEALAAEIKARTE
jgi:type II secretory pathway pseudopilin PulG